ncbi:MAG: hypothetical protein N2Z62_00890 [Rhodobacteraceae bacterium]|nr:hypothetical protein [Paracoccaceae bacterium]
MILPLLLALAGGMAVGSIHNAQMRDALPGIATPTGFLLIALSLILFLSGIWILLRIAGGARGGATLLVPALVAAAIELLNLGLTLAEAGSLGGWLFHEYLGLGAALLLVAQLLLDRGRA